MGNETSPVRQVKEFYNRTTSTANGLLRSLARWWENANKLG